METQIAYLRRFNAYLEGIWMKYTTDILTPQKFDNAKQKFREGLDAGFIEDIVDEFVAHKGEKFFFHIQCVKIRQGSLHTFGKGWSQEPVYFDYAVAGIISTEIDRCIIIPQKAESEQSVADWYTSKFPIPTTELLVTDQMSKVFKESKEPFYLVQTGGVRQKVFDPIDWDVTDLYQALIPDKFGPIFQFSKESTMYSKPVAKFAIGNDAVKEALAEYAKRSRLDGLPDAYLAKA